VEYTRRVETTNLRSLENLLTKLEDKGEKVRRDLSEDHYRSSLNHYLLGLKSRYDNKKMRVREMNDLQYYVWILRNGKF
jgi:predicted metalloprotease